MVRLHASSYFEVNRRSDGIVVFRRTSEPFESAREVEIELAAIEGAFEGSDHGAMLLDLRDVIGVHDPEIAQALGKLRHYCHRNFEPVACLVRSMAGALQLQRLLSEEGLAGTVHRHEQEALDLLRGPDTAVGQ